VILRLNGVGVVEEAGLYRIVPINDVSREPIPISSGRKPEAVEVKGKVLFHVTPVYYIPSAEVIRLITPFCSANAILVDVTSSNQIIIVDTDASVKRVLQLVDIFDNEQLKQKKPQVFVYQVQNSRAKDVANLLHQIFLGARSSPAAGGKSGNLPGGPPQTVARSGEAVVSDITKIFPDEGLNSIIVLATPDDYEIIRETIEKIDIMPRQVVIEGVIASVALTDNLSLGMAWTIKSNIDALGLKGVIGFNAGDLADIDPKTPLGTGFTFVGTDSKGAVRALLNTLASTSKAKLLAAPHILVSDNREAKIQVGSQVPIVTSETYGAVGVAPQRNIQYKDTGIILRVRPRVNESGLVSLDLNQEVSTFRTIALSSADKEIVIDKTEAATNVVVQNGETIIIGGLIREDDTKSRTGIPVLSKIPLLGFLFGDTSNEQQRTEIIILLTPHVVKNQQAAKEITSRYVDSFAGAGRGKIRKEELLRARPSNGPLPAKGASGFSGNN